MRLMQTELQGLAIASRWTFPRKAEVGQDVHVEQSEKWVSNYITKMCVSSRKLKNHYTNFTFLVNIRVTLGLFSHSRSGLTVEFQGELVGFGAWVMKTIHGIISSQYQAHCYKHKIHILDFRYTDIQLLYVYMYGEILIDVISQNILSFTSEICSFNLSRNTCATNPKHLFKSTNVGFMWFCWLHAQPYQRNMIVLLNFGILVLYVR
jgi:hypothetical protein